MSKSGLHSHLRGDYIFLVATHDEEGVTGWPELVPDVDERWVH